MKNYLFKSNILTSWELTNLPSQVTNKLVITRLKQFNPIVKNHLIEVNNYPAAKIAARKILEKERQKEVKIFG